MRTSSLLGVASAACLITVFGGCAGRDLTAPTGRSPRARPDLVAPGGSELPMPNETWSSFFTPPPNSSPQQIAAITPVEVGIIPDSAWIVINVGGSIRETWNPECAYAPPSWPCQTASVVSPFESEPSEGTGPVRMWANGGLVKLRGVGGANSSSGIGLLYPSNGGPIAGQINAQPRWAWDPNFGTGPFTYFLSGGYDVSVMKVASPIGISDSGPLDSLGTRRYTVEPLYGLQFINPLDFYWHPPAGDINWYFVPGDSVSQRAGWTEGYFAIPECRYQVVCEYIPPGPGRVQAAAYVETRRAVLRSNNVCAVPDDPDGVDDEEVVSPTNCGPMSRRCPKILGKVVTAGVRVAGTLHTFKFEGPFTRIGLQSVPGTYPIRPTVSEDGWWIAESGTITVDCWGFYIPIRSGVRVFVGHASYRTGDLHVVMGPSHPDFHNTTPE